MIPATGRGDPEGATIRTILVVDDARRMREHLRDLLVAHMPDLVVAEAEDGESALQLLEEVQPDLVLVDMIMPGMNGIEVTRQARAAYPGLKVIIISLHAHRSFVEGARVAGASAYLVKDRLHEELFAAIEAVAHGETLFSPVDAPPLGADPGSRQGDQDF